MASSLIVLLLVFALDQTSPQLFAQVETPKSRASYWAAGGENTTEIKEELSFINRQELFQKVSGNQILFLDTRESNEFEKSHLPASLHVPYHQINESFEEIKKQAAGKTIVPYCNWDFRAYVAGVELKCMGYSDVQMMYPHGLKGWQAVGLPLAGKESGKSDSNAQSELTQILAVGKFPLPMGEGQPPKASLAKGGGKGGISPSFQPSPSKGEGEIRHITMRILKKRVEPRHIKASVGNKLILELSAEEEDHWFVMPDFGINLKLRQGEKQTVEINLTKSGYFPYGCISCCMTYQCQVRQAILVDLKDDPSFYGE